MAHKPLAPADKPPVVPAAKTVGEERDEKLSAVKPNAWNPNRMTPFQQQSLEQELRTTGWLRSMKILVWGKDEKGVEQNIIIDGEHRWKASRKVGFKSVPMVFLDGLTEAEAKRLTVKIDATRGSMDPDALGGLLRELRADMAIPEYSMDVGIDEAQLAALLMVPEVQIDEGLGPKSVSRSPKVSLEFGSSERRDEFKAMLAAMCKGKGDRPAGDVLLAKLKKAVA